MSDYIKFPLITNFKVKDFQADTIKINENIINSNNNNFSLPNTSGTLALTSEINQSVVSAVNSNIIYCSIALGAVISYTNDPALSSASFPSTGTLNVNITGSKFSQKPICIATPLSPSQPSNNTSIYYDYINSTTNLLIFYSNVNTVATNIPLNIIIIGPA
jgi:hypothetical protein